jgi:hypothetical protein
MKDSNTTIPKGTNKQKPIEKLVYALYENLGVEYPPIKEIVEKINEIIDQLNNLKKKGKNG